MTKQKINLKPMSQPPEHGKPVSVVVKGDRRNHMYLAYFNNDEWALDDDAYTRAIGWFDINEFEIVPPEDPLADCVCGSPTTTKYLGDQHWYWAECLDCAYYSPDFESEQEAREWHNKAMGK